MSGKRLSDPPAREILGPGNVDDLAAGLIALTRELWVVIDRMTMLERLLERHGIATADLDRLEPDEATQKRLDARRAALLDTVLGAMGGSASQR